MDAITSNPRSDRRADDRVGAAIACKVLPEGASSYLAGSTVDVSRGGALLEVRTPRALATGDRVRVALCWSGERVLKRRDLIEAEVARAEPFAGSSQRVAVRFVSERADAEIVVRLEAASAHLTPPRTAA